MKLVDKGRYVAKESDLTTYKAKVERKAKNTPTKDLKNRAENKSSGLSKRVVETYQYERDQYVVEYVLRRAKGICQLCNQNAPFIRKDGEPFLEVHHIHFLAEGGSDAVWNAVALCPNCHRRMHHLNNDSDKAHLVTVASIML